MKRTKYFNLALYFMGISILLSACTFVKPVEIGNIQKLDINSIKFSEIKADVELELKNPNPFAINVEAVDLSFDVEGIDIGEIKSNEAFTIEANSDAIVELPVDFFPDVVVQNAFKVMGMFSKESNNIKVNGDVTVRFFIFKKKVKLEQESNVVFEK